MASVSGGIRHDLDSGSLSPPVILGGSNLIAGYLLRRLAAEDRGAIVIARRPVVVPYPSEFRQIDVLGAGTWIAPRGTTVVSVLPLAVLIRALSHLEEAAAIVAIGSTSVFSKASSLDPHDRTIALSLADAEASLKTWCEAREIQWTILRPTLVYDGFGDRNIARLTRVIRRYGVLPVAAPARGLRQPIHADDIAKAILACIGNPAAANRAFDIAGGEVLTYRAMVERVFAAQGRKPRFIPLPIGLLETGFRLATACGLLRQDGVGVSVFRRMNEDLVFDIAPGLEALRYAPRRFELQKQLFV